ncbi:MAG: response regulator [Anaerolineae bacterium]|nr:response regulator [Anaerolineae bacterium]
MKTILLIEDNPYDARLVMQVLGKNPDYRLLHALDATDGLRLATEESPDLILLDMGLPDMDGQTVAGVIKHTSTLADIPLVAVTAWPPDVARDMAEAYGCAGYISKPFSVKDFAEKIASFFVGTMPS